MSAQATISVAASPSTKTKKKNKKKKVGAGKTDGKDESPVANGAVDGAAEDDGDEGDEAAAEDVQSPAVEHPSTESRESNDSPVPSSNGAHSTTETTEKLNGLSTRNTTHPDSDSRDGQEGLTQEKLDALAKERDELKSEVTKLRQSLESIAGQHDEDLSTIREELEQSKGEKDHAEAQYQNLLGRVNAIRSQLEGKLKADAAEIAQARTQIEELEEQNRQLQDAQDQSDTTLAQLRADNQRQVQDIDELRSRTNLSQSNWIKERDEFLARETKQREKFEEARQAMQDWEVLASEERSQREHLADKVAEFEERIVTHREAFEKAARERDEQVQTVDGLQRALRDIQDARKKELRELVETSQSQLEELRTQLQSAEETATSTQNDLDETRKELERAAPFEEQVREKNLAIGKLRHETVTLKEHLTKALRFLKQRKPEDTVDRQLVTNHVLHFIALDRADPKKFQVLQLIAALLAWTDEQKEQAGLSRPGAIPVTGSLRLPQTPFRRTPSTPQLGGDPMAFESIGGSTKESLAELWSDFLEREAEEGRPGPASRKGSAATLPAIAGSSKSSPPTGLGLH